jgi:DNA-binding response OmpR family regulator
MMAGAEIIQLSPTQAEIIYSLAEAMPLPLAHERLFAKLWGQNPIDNPEVTLRVIVTKLRKKIKPAGMNIKSVWGVGYALEYGGA